MLIHQDDTKEHAEAFAAKDNICTKALSEYKEGCLSLGAELEQSREPSRIKYEKAQEKADAEYKTAKEKALIEYNKALLLAKLDYDKAITLDKDEYEKVCADTWAKYEQKRHPLWVICDSICESAQAKYKEFCKKDLIETSAKES